MNVDELLTRLKKAAEQHSLRDLKTMCKVSHERLRSLINGSEPANITAATYNKISEGLRNNGF